MNTIFVLHPAETSGIKPSSINQSPLLEIACFNISSAIAAAQAGADRIELCDSPADGGTTPSFGTIQTALEKIAVPVFPIIRPRGGDFLYTNEEYDVMLRDVQLCRQLNCKGVVLGVLLKDGRIDVQRSASLVQAAAPMAVTFHRAFDRAAQPLQALEDVIKTGCTRLLTSGQKLTAIEGKHLIKQLVVQAANRIIIMPGSGVRNYNMKELAEYTGATQFHSSARVPAISAMKFRVKDFKKDSENVGADKEEIKAMKLVLTSIDR